MGNKQGPMSATESDECSPRKKEKRTHQALTRTPQRQHVNVRMIEVRLVRSGAGLFARKNRMMGGKRSQSEGNSRTGGNGPDRQITPKIPKLLLVPEKAIIVMQRHTNYIESSQDDLCARVMHTKF